MDIMGICFKLANLVDAMYSSTSLSSLGRTEMNLLAYAHTLFLIEVDGHIV